MPGRWTRRTCAACAVGIGLAGATRAVCAQGTRADADSSALANRDSATVGGGRLNPLISTATGVSQHYLERGSSASVIVVDSLAAPPLADFSDLLVAGAPGMRVQRSSGTTGAGASIHLRGLTSLLARGDPLLIVDGVRIDNATAASLVDLGPQQPSRFDDLDPEDIERVEVLPGPAAGALFGGGAADGVIVVTTRHGRPGRPRWHLHSEYGAISDVTTYPANFSRPTAAWPYVCGLDRQALTGCVPGELQSWNPLERVSPFQTGSHQRNGLSVGGGGNAVRYHVAGDYDEERGVFSNNGRRRVNVRTNIDAHIGRFLNVRLTGGYMDGTLRLPSGGGTAIIGEGLFGAAEDDSVLRGYQNASVADELQLGPLARTSRIMAGLTATVRPLRWLTSTTTIGMDSVVVSSVNLTPHRDSTGSVVPGPGRTITGSQLATYTANTDLSASFDLSSSVSATSSIGVECFRRRGEDSILVAPDAAPIADSRSGNYSLRWSAARRSTLSEYVRQQLGWRKRLFVTAGLRHDRSKNLIRDDGGDPAVLSPSASVSWLVSDEPFFPHPGWLRLFRVRAAYGSTARPVWITALYDGSLTGPSPIVNGVFQDRSLWLFATILGEPPRQPERTRETEAGLDLVLFGDRLQASLTYYDRTTSHLRIIRQIPGSYPVLTDIGRMRNRGVETTIGATLLRSRPVTWHVTVAGATNANKMLGGGTRVPSFLINEAQLSLKDGYPPEPFWDDPVTGYSDKNGDGIISRLGCVRPIDGPSAPTCELTFGAEQTYLGSPTPTRTLSVASRVTLFGRATVSAMLDHRGGYKRFDLTRQLRCDVARATCRAAQDPAAPQSDQATVAAGNMGVMSGYIEDAGFWKLREVALTLSAPKRWAQRIAASDLRLTLAGRNLATWTSYRGLDPETADFAQPPVRYLTARLDVTW